MPSPLFNVWQFSAPDKALGASSLPLPCLPGDTVTFTASIRYVSGGMQPLIGVWFWDATQTNNYGALLIAPPNTDSGWHNYTFTVQVPSPAVTMTVQTVCQYLGVLGTVNAQLTADVYPGANVVCLVTNTTDMTVGETVTITHIGRGLVNVNTVPILAVNPGVSFTANLTKVFYSGDSVVNTYPPSGTYFVGFQPAGFVPLGPSGASQTAWEVSDYRLTWTPQGTTTPQPQYAPLATFSSATGFSYDQTQEFIFPLYYLSLITSLYKGAPNFYAWCSTLLIPSVDRIACTQQLYQSFALPSTAALLGFLNQAQGVQLDIIGQIVGVSRTLPYQPGVNTQLSEAITSIGSPPVAQAVTVAGLNPPGAMGTSGMQLGAYVNIGGASPESVEITAFTPGVGFSAVFTRTHLVNSPVTSQTPPSAVLSDADYVTLLTAKIAQNNWDGLIHSVYQLLNSLFPGSGILIEDGGLVGTVMTAIVVLPGGTLTPMQEQLLIFGLIIPRSQAVLYIYTYATLPMFGWETANTSFIAAWGTGNFI